jgi:hypothetical protein
MLQLATLKAAAAALAVSHGRREKGNADTLQPAPDIYAFHLSGPSGQPYTSAAGVPPTEAREAPVPEAAVTPGAGGLSDAALLGLSADHTGPSHDGAACDCDGTLDSAPCESPAGSDSRLPAPPPTSPRPCSTGTMPPLASPSPRADDNVAATPSDGRSSFDLSPISASASPSFAPSSSGRKHPAESVSFKCHSTPLSRSRWGWLC